MLEIGSGCIQHDVMKCYVTGRGSVMSCNVLGEATVTRISTLSGRGKRRRGGLEDLQNVTTQKIFSFLHNFSTFNCFKTLKSEFGIEQQNINISPPF